MPGSNTVTIKEVAEAAGVSFTHVSRAYRNPSLVSEKTRQRIYEAASMLGYHPNMAASILASKDPRRQRTEQHGSLAYVFENPDPNFVGTYGKACKARAIEIGYGFEIANLTVRQKIRALINELRARGVLGVIFGPRRSHLAQAELWDEFSLVSCELPLKEPARCLVVHTDKFQAVLTAVENAYLHGYRRMGITLVRHQDDFMDDQHRLGAWELCAKNKRYSDCRFLPPFFDDFSRSNTKGFIQWVETKKPDLVIGFTELEHFRLQEAGYSMPADLGFISLCQIRAGLPESGCVEDLEKVAQRAVEWCDQLVRLRVRGWTSNPDFVVISPVWNQGSTLRQKN